MIYQNDGIENGMSRQDMCILPEARPEAVSRDTIEALLAKMTLQEKIGQLQQLDASGDPLAEDFLQAVRAGKVGSIINQVDPETSNTLQRVAVEESRLGIPLISARDVIHGFRTVFPIPLGQAASWNPGLVEQAARISALEARRNGVHWTFAPMVDISRDPRWGRIAESFGEDPYLSGCLGASMVRGFQTSDLQNHGAIAACAKHFAGYGASESGRDYNSTNIPDNELRNVYLPPFRAAAEAGAATFMCSFGDLDGIPATANDYLIRQILRGEWEFDGLVVSDWNSVKELVVHGLCEDARAAAKAAASAGVDIEMAGDAYQAHLESLVVSGQISIETIDGMVLNVLRLKERLGLFEKPYTAADEYPPLLSEAAKELAKDLATQSLVLLKNEDRTLPLKPAELSSIAVIGPLADAAQDQLGTWVFDGHADDSVTPLAAIRQRFGETLPVRYACGLPYSRSRDQGGFDEAVAVAAASDVALVFLGEESILSGEAHCRADLSLPGAQAELLEQIRKTGTRTIVIVMAGRPLVLTDTLKHMDALVYAWHPGTFAGPAIADLLFGDADPFGKLPVTFPKAVGQIPVYYNHKKTGRPPEGSEITLIDEIPVGAQQTSLGMSAFHLDQGFEPLFPFGFGLTYSEFTQSDLQLTANRIEMAGKLGLSCKLTNIGQRRASELVQLYIRDVAGSLTRPVRELKSFKRVSLEPGASEVIRFELTQADLAFSRRDKTFGAEPGKFEVWVGTSSVGGMTATFELLG